MIPATLSSAWRCRLCKLDMLTPVRPLACWFCGGTNSADAAPAPAVAPAALAAGSRAKGSTPEDARSVAMVTADERLPIRTPSDASRANVAAPSDASAPPPAFAWGSDVTPETVERATSGLPWVAAVTGELARKKLTMVGGRRGTGKSRLLLDIAGGCVRETGRPVLFALNDGMDANAMVAAAREIGLSDELSRIAFVDGYDLERIALAWSSLSPVLAIVDAFSNVRLRGEKCGERGDAQTAAIGDPDGIVRQLARANDTAAVLVMHMTTEGQFSGGATVQQLSDVVVRLDRDENDKRRVVLGIDDKNRHGPVDVTETLRFVDGGRLVPWKRGARVRASKTAKGIAA